MKRLLLIAGLLTAVLAIPSTASAATCSDYSNQADAQNAADTRDADGDGIYCEALPCPCSTGGGESGGGGGGGGTVTPPTPAPKPKPKPKPKAKRYEARITSVVDGDTIRVKATGAPKQYYRVRLIGIDTPETKRPGTPLECGGLEATASMLRLAFTAPTDSNGDGLEDKAGGEGRRVILKTDPSQGTYDKYGRLLAYVNTLSGTSLAAMQLQRGWSDVYVYADPFARQVAFESRADDAEIASRGAWEMCDGNFHQAA